MGKIKLFFDFEFTGLHANTTPISLGISSQSIPDEPNSGYATWHCFYAEFTDYDETQLNNWLRENVLPKLLSPKLKEGASSVRDTEQNQFCGLKKQRFVRGNSAFVAEQLLDFINKLGKDVEFWGDVCIYDWLLMHKLLGEYKNGITVLPSSIFYICHDLATLFAIKGIDPDISRAEFLKNPERFGVDATLGFAKIWAMSFPDVEHHALNDAIMIRECYEYLQEL